MRVTFDWDPAKASANLAKHGVAFEEAMEVFGDPLAATRPDEDSAREQRWITLGLTRAMGYCLVVHTYAEKSEDEAVIRVISARRPTKGEARQYEEGGSQ